MDFLDPRKRRSHRTRLILGYGLVGIAIMLATIILVYAAYGYGIDTKTGTIVQNGLLFVDSKPGGAEIHLNGSRYQNATTAARLVLPAKEYDLKLEKDGYRSWQRKFFLEEHSVARYVYPFLFPQKPFTSSLKIYPRMPEMITQSPDRRWVLVQVPSSSRAVSFDQFDTSNLKDPVRTLSLPLNLLATGAPGSFTEIEWASDNNFLILQHTYNGGHEFIMLDRRQPSQSVNLNRLFKINPTQILMRNKKSDRLYIYDQAAKTVRIGVLGSGALEPVLLSQVLAFKPYGNSLISYVTDRQSPAGQVSFGIWDNGSTYLLAASPVAERYLLDAAQFHGSWYYIIGSSAGDRIKIFKDPLSDLKDSSIGRAHPVRTLRLEGTTGVKFSENTRFIAAQAGQEFAVYDFEEDDSYNYKLKEQIAAPLKWMDGHRLIGTTEGQVFVIDFDATNKQVIIPTSQVNGGYFSGNYNRLFTLSAAAAGGSGVALQNIDMRAGTDLPQDPLD